jgi:DNA-binding NarL/FixJ family response regulator
VSAKPRVVLADDHPVVLAGLRSLIQADPEIEFVGEATTGLPP